MCTPLSIARSSQAVLARTKTDATDARRIARSCEAHDVAPWAPASPAQQQLRGLLTARETLVQERLRLSNRQHAAGSTACQALVAELQAPVLAALETRITRIDRELAELAAADTPLGAQARVVVTIPGLGLTTAGALLASLPSDRLRTSRQVAASVGVCPQERTSGSSLRGPRIYRSTRPRIAPQSALSAGDRGHARQPGAARLRRAPARHGQASRGRPYCGHAQAAAPGLDAPAHRPTLLIHPPRATHRRLTAKTVAPQDHSGPTRRITKAVRYGQILAGCTACQG